MARWCYRVCRATIGDFHEAEDAFQATFLVLVKEAPPAQGPRFPGALALPGRRAGVAVCPDHARRRRTVTSKLAGIEAFAASAGPDPGTQNECRARRSRQNRSRRDLPIAPRFQSCLILCDLEGSSYAEAARQLHLPLGTVQSRLARARKRLREGLGTSRTLLPKARVGRSGFDDRSRRSGCRLTAHIVGTNGATLPPVRGQSRATASDIVSASISSLVRGGTTSDHLVAARSGWSAAASMFILVTGLAVYSQTGGKSRPEAGEKETRSQEPAAARASDLTRLLRSSRLAR